MARLNSRKRKSKRKSRKKRSRKRNQKGGAIDVKMMNKDGSPSFNLENNLDNKKIKKMALETLKEGQTIQGNKVPFKNAEDYIQHFLFKLENYMSEYYKKKYNEKDSKKIIFKDRKFNFKDDGVRLGVIATSIFTTYVSLKKSFKRKKLTFAASLTPVMVFLGYVFTEGLYKEFFGNAQNIPKYVADAWNNDDLHPSSTDKITQKFVKETIIKLTKDSREIYEKHQKELQEKIKNKK